MLANEVSKSLFRHNPHRPTGRCFFCLHVTCWRDLTCGCADVLSSFSTPPLACRDGGISQPSWRAWRTGVPLQLLSSREAQL